MKGYVQIFAEGGEANGLTFDVQDSFPVLVLASGGVRSLKYELAKPFRVWGGLPVYVEAEIEIPAERLEGVEVTQIAKLRIEMTTIHITVTGIDEAKRKHEEFQEILRLINPFRRGQGKVTIIIDAVAYDVPDEPPQLPEPPR